ncbi:MAG: Chaperone protein DnaK, partial [uncultured Solirubrobacteraceae bacterium]
GKDHRHRPRHDEFVHGRPRGRRADRDRELRGRAHHPLGRRLRPVGRAA